MMQSTSWLASWTDVPLSTGQESFVFDRDRFSRMLTKIPDHRGRASIKDADSHWPGPFVQAEHLTIAGNHTSVRGTCRHPERKKRVGNEFDRKLTSALLHPR